MFNDFFCHQIVNIVHNEVNRKFIFLAYFVKLYLEDPRWFSISAPTAFPVQPLTNTPDSTNQTLVSVVEETGVIVFFEIKKINKKSNIILF